MPELEELLRLDKHHWIKEFVPGKSFADVGGLWGTVNETVSIAMLSKASSATMIDIQPFGNEWWEKFDERCKEFGLTDYSKKQLDVCHSDSLKGQQKYDFVHCSGILYHVSDPIQFIQNLISLANEYVLISSMCIPDYISNDSGELISPVGTSHLVPCLSESNRKVLGDYLETKGIKRDPADKRTTQQLFEKDRTVNARPWWRIKSWKKEIKCAPSIVNTGPWWWIYSPETMEEFCKTCGLEIIKSHTNTIFSHSVLCKIT